MRVLMLGDVVGKPGRHAIDRHMPKLFEEHRPDFVIANGENAAGGLGITKETALPLFDSGVNVITLGNHVWSQNSAAPYMEREMNLVRPANYPPGAPGRGYGVFETVKGPKIGVINLLGRVFMQPLDDPFRTADAIVEEIRRETPIILIDIHAEATSEKAALAWDLDGKVSAVIGTHTHVQTCDARILPKGTAFLTDVGMCGPRDSVLGMKTSVVISNFRTQMKMKFELAEGPGIVSYVIVDIDEETGKSTRVEPFRIVEEN